MRHQSLAFLISLLLLWVIFPMPAAAQDNPTFTVQTILLENLPAYDLKVAPDGRVAAVYLGATAQALLGIPLLEYTVEPSLLPIRLLDLTNGAEIARLTGATDYTSDVAFSPDGALLASYHRNGMLYLWDVTTGQLRQQLTAIIGAAKLAFLPDGKRLLIYPTDSQIGQFLVWDLQTGYMTEVWRASYRSLGELRLTQAPGNLDYRYVTFALSPDGAWLATATPNGELRFWDTASLQQAVIQPRSEDQAQLMQFNIRTLRFSPDSQTLVYFDQLTKQTIFWDVATQSAQMSFPDGNAYFGVSPNMDALIWATRQEVWFARPDQPDSAVKVLDLDNDLLTAAPLVSFSPDRTSVVVGGFGSRAGTNTLIYVITLG